MNSFATNRSPERVALPGIWELFPDLIPPRTTQAFVPPSLPPAHQALPERSASHTKHSYSQATAMTSSHNTAKGAPLSATQSSPAALPVKSLPNRRFVQPRSSDASKRKSPAIIKISPAKAAPKRRRIRSPRRRIYPCDMCDIITERPSSLKQHMRTHTGEQPYKCCYCGRAFASKSNAHRHEHSCIFANATPPFAPLLPLHVRSRSELTSIDGGKSVDDELEQGPGPTLHLGHVFTSSPASSSSCQPPHEATATFSTFRVNLY